MRSPLEQLSLDIRTNFSIMTTHLMNPLFASPLRRAILHGICVLSALLTVPAAHAGSGIFKDYVIISGSGATYSGTQQYFNIMGGVGTNFQGFNFGTFNPSAGQTLVLNGFEVNTFQNGGDDIQSAFGDYRIREKGTTFTETSLGFRNGCQRRQKMGRHELEREPSRRTLERHVYLRHLHPGARGQQRVRLRSLRQ